MDAIIRMVIRYLGFPVSRQGNGHAHNRSIIVYQGLLVMLSQKLLQNLIEAAKDVYPDYPIMQRVVVSQGIHESGFASQRGGSQLAIKYNNLFGIKAKTGQEAVLLPTWEEINGKVVHVKAPFAVYPDHEACFKAHRALMERPRYKPVLGAKTVKEAFSQLQKCGYATDGAYPRKLELVYSRYVEKEFGQT